MKTREIISAALSDSQLIAYMQVDCNKVISILMLRHNAHLKKYLHSLLRNICWEEDALQNLWMAVLLEIRKNNYHEEGKFLKWLNTLAFCIAKSIVRKELHYIHDEKKLALMEKKQTEELTEGRDDAEESARTGYKHLKPLPQDIVDLHYNAHLTFEEIGVKKGMTAGNARIIFFRALKRIKKYMEISTGKNIFKKV